jgi:hypothetical protein
MSESPGRNPLHLAFRTTVHEAVAREAPGRALEDVEDYLTSLLVSFLRTDRIFAIKDAAGRPLRSVYEMLAEGDVRLNAPTFEREREVHKHIGDYILFWSGFNPQFLSRLKLDDGRDLLCDYTRQGQQSYWVVSTFDYQPFDQEAPTFRKLSDAFEPLTAALAHVRSRLPYHVA